LHIAITIHLLRFTTAAVSSCCGLRILADFATCARVKKRAIFFARIQHPRFVFLTQYVALILLSQAAVFFSLRLIGLHFITPSSSRNTQFWDFLHFEKYFLTSS
jgi:hypothetical protein